MRRPRLTYANVMSTVALFVAMGGGAYAATNDTPVKLVRAPVFVSAATTDSSGSLATYGVGTGTATCPKSYTAVGGGFIGLTTDTGAITPTTSSMSATNHRQWIVWFDSLSTRRETMYVTATCVRDSAL